MRVGKSGMMQLLHGFAARLALCSSRGQRNQHKSFSDTSEWDQRGTCLAERPARGSRLCLLSGSYLIGGLDKGVCGGVTVGQSKRRCGQSDNDFHPRTLKPWQQRVACNFSAAVLGLQGALAILERSSLVPKHQKLSILR